MNTEGRSALITGASSGIGRELAFLCARDAYRPILVARSADALAGLGEEIGEAYGIAPRIVVKDLADPRSPGELHEELADEGLEIEILINNAGFGSHGFFVEMDLHIQLDMLQVNVLALTHLTRLFLPQMVRRGRGSILNVASTAAFQPGPLMAVYYASKAYVLSLSEGLAEELGRTGVTVTALCPGPTATAFQVRAGTDRLPLFRRIGMMDARTVAEQGYRGMKKGKAVVVTGARNAILAQAVRVAPRALVRKIVRILQAPP